MGRVLEVFKSYKFYLIAAILIGIFVRLYGLNIQSLWYDELFSVTAASLNWTQMFRWLLRDVHPPLYYVFLHYWISIFGSSEVILRLPCAIAGIATVFVTYFMSNRNFNRYISTSTTIMMALSCSAIVYSQEARGYAFSLLFCTALTFIWLELIKEINNSHLSGKLVIIYGLLAILTAFTHYFGFMFVIIQIFYLFCLSLLYKRSRVKILLLGLTVAFSLLPWLLIHLPYLIDISKRNLWIDRVSLNSFILLINFIFNKKLIILLLLPIFFNIKGFLTNIKSTELKPYNIALLYLLIMPVLLVVIISFQKNSIFYPRYFIIILPAAYLLFAILTSLSPKFSGIKGNAYIFVVTLTALVLCLFVPGNNTLDYTNPFYKPYKQQWRDASKYVLDNYNEDSVILIDLYPKIYNYYFNKLNKSNRKLNIETHNGIIMVKQKYKRALIFSNFAKFPDSIQEPLKDASIKYQVKDFTNIYIYDCTFE